MIDRDHKLPLARQAKVVGISRGSIYYRPRPVGEAGLRLMRRIDELHLEYPFAGSRMMRGLLRQEGLSSGRRHIATLMRRMGIEALYRKPNTSRRRPGHTVYPYLLRGLEVSRPNQVWAMDITYIPMARGFVYLAAVTGQPLPSILPRMPRHGQRAVRPVRRHSNPHTRCRTRPGAGRLPAPPRRV